MCKHVVNFSHTNGSLRYDKVLEAPAEKSAVLRRLRTLPVAGIRGRVIGTKLEVSNLVGRERNS
jgi:hypothetical protein